MVLPSLVPQSSLERIRIPTDACLTVPKFYMYQTGIGTNMLVMTLISFIVGLSISGQTFYTFILEFRRRGTACARGIGKGSTLVPRTPMLAIVPPEATMSWQVILPAAQALRQTRWSRRRADCTRLNRSK